MDIKNIIIILSLLVTAGLCLYTKGKNWKQLIIAFSIALAWTAYYRYEYQGANIFLYDQINVYPLILWTTGLVVLGQIYMHTRFKHRFLWVVILYWALLLLVEAIGYYLLDIRLNSNYTSLLNLGVIHAPSIMKVFYLVAGPAFLLIAHMDRAGKKYMV